ncbi:hypothetical protein D3C83_78350 [compost metagenome]
MRVGRIVCSEDDWNREQRGELHPPVEPEIVRVGPPGYACDPDADRNREQGTLASCSEVLGEEPREQRHECYRHRQAIPHQGGVVRRPMVVSRARGNAGDSQEKHGP